MGNVKSTLIGCQLRCMAYIACIRHRIICRVAARDYSANPVQRVEIDNSFECSEMMGLSENKYLSSLEYDSCCKMTSHGRLCVISALAWLKVLQHAQMTAVQQAKYLPLTLNSDIPPTTH